MDSVIVARDFLVNYVRLDIVLKIVMDEDYVNPMGSVCVKSYLVELLVKL